MTKDTPTIDVIIPTYNNGKFILDAIRSVEAQSIRPNTLFIIDDGSTDNTADIVRKYKKESKLLITYIRKENNGPNSARNRGILLSNAEYVAFLDADDIWTKDKLEKQFAVFSSRTYSNTGLVYSRYGLIDENGIKIDGSTVPLDRNFSGKAYLHVLRANKILGSASSVFIQREVFSTVGLFDENLRFSEDWDMWIRIAERYEIDFADEILVYIRRHSENSSKNLRKSFIGEIEFYNKWIPNIDMASIPIEWKERIMIQIMRRLPRFDFMPVLKEKMQAQVYRDLFPLGITYKSIISFGFKKLMTRILK